MRKPSCALLRITCLTALLSALTVIGYAQNLTGTINGTVRDDSGAVIPNATVTITSSDTGVVQRRLQTNESGRYVAAALQQGNYTVEVTMAGFKTFVMKGIRLDLDQTLPVDATMHVGALTTEVQVTETQMAVNTEDNSASITIGSKEILALPLTERNFVQMLQLQPGVNAGLGTNSRGPSNISGGNNQVQFSVQGQGHTANGFFFDGVDFMNHDTNLILGMYPSIDAIAEMNLLRAGYGAQYGGSGSSVTNLVSKAGTDAFHGTAYFFFRNQDLNANTYFNKQAGVDRQPYRHNDFGFSVGGPVLLPHIPKDLLRTYFFVSGEYQRLAQPVNTSNTNIPTQEERNGIFDKPVCINYNASGTCTATSSTITNVDPMAAIYLKEVIDKMPLPNNPNDPHGLIYPLVGTINENQTLVRIDHTFNTKLSGFFRYINDPYNNLAPEGIGANPVSMPLLSTTRGIVGASDYLGHLTWSPTSTWVVEGGFSYLHSYIYADIIGLLAKKNLPDFQPLMPYENTSTRVATVTINGLAWKAAGPINRVNNETQGFINVSKTLGNHFLMFGGNAEKLRTIYQTLSTTPGSFAFKGPNVAGDPLGAWRQSFADFLIGYATSFSQGSPDGNDLVNAALLEGYVQDNWKVTRRLTVNAGVRYTYFRQPTNEMLPIVNFDPARFVVANAPTIDTNGDICAKSPCKGGAAYKTYDTLNGLLIANDKGPYGRKTVSQPNMDFAPRFGFAFTPFADGHTVVRGGYGIYYIVPDVWENLVNQASNNPPFIQSTSTNNTSFDAPNGGLPSAASAAPAPQSIFATQINQQMPYQQAFNLDLQQEFPKNFMLDIGYYGNVARKLIGNYELNQPQAGEYVTAGIAAPGAINTAAITTKLNRIRPYLGYSSIAGGMAIGSSNYNSLQVAARKSFRYGSQLGLSYTWSKAMGINGAQDTTNLAADYGPTDDQRANILNVHGVYDMPWFHDQKGLKGYLLGGFQVSTIVNYLTGPVKTITTSGVDPAGIGAMNSANSVRPDQIGNPNNGPKTITKYFNTAAFQQVPASQLRPGNAPVNSILGPGAVSLTLGLMRNFRLAEVGSLQLRAEAFNTLNHANFNAPNVNLTAANFGHITGTSDPRIMQVAAKFVF